jgi:hypothetical protein
MFEEPVTKHPRKRDRHKIGDERDRLVEHGPRHIKGIDTDDRRELQRKMQEIGRIGQRADGFGR